MRWQCCCQVWGLGEMVEGKCDVAHLWSCLMVLFWMVVELCVEQGVLVCMPGRMGGAWEFLGPWWVDSFGVCTWVTKIGNEVLGIAFVVGVGVGVGVGGGADGGGKFSW